MNTLNKNEVESLKLQLERLIEKQQTKDNRSMHNRGKSNKPSKTPRKDTNEEERDKEKQANSFS